MRPQVPFLIVIVFCSAIGATVQAALPLQECRLESGAAGGSAAARCGWYVVAENRDDPNSKELQLHVAVVPALRLKPAADPLFILSGGPGQAASDFYLSVSPAFARIRRDRDIVLIDQRGTGRSNRLDCALTDDLDLTLADPDKLRKLARDCLRTLPGDPRHYTTSIAVRDLDEVRAALGYESIDLYGVSYGTRVAQHYMRRHPNRVRAAILDGVVPAQLGLGPDVAIDAQRALDRAFRRCSTDERCAREFPDIARHFASLRARLRKAPVIVTVPDPVTAKLTTTTLDASRLAAAVRLLSYTDETVSTLPLLIRDAEVLQQPQALAAQYLMIERRTQAQIADGMHFAVVCSEDAPRWAEQRIDEAALAKTYLGADFMRAMQGICAEWPRGPVDADFGAPMRSDVPVLMLSGSNDPVTPQRYAERVIGGFSDAKHLVLEGQGHGQIATGCVPRIAAQFIAQGSSAALDDACVKDVVPAAFMLSRAASAP